MSRTVPVLSLMIFLILIVSAGAEAGEVTHSINDIDLSEIQITGSETEGYVLGMKGYIRMNYLGYPALPYKVISLLIPQGEEVVSCRLEAGAVNEEFGEIRLELFQGEYLDDGTKRGLSADESEVIGEGTVFPSFSVRYLGTGIYRGYQIAAFAVYPFRYDIGSGLLTVETGMTLKVETVPSMVKQSADRVRYVEGFREKSQAEVELLVENPSSAGSYVFNDVKVEGVEKGFLPGYLPGLEGSEVLYLIITNEEMAPAFQLLADSKTKKGVPAVVRTVEWITQNYWNGADRAETIRNFIVEAYAKWGVEWVLLGGDVDVIPARYGFVAFFFGEFIPADIYYSCLDGSWNDDGDSLWGEAYAGTLIPGDDADLYSDVFVGRIPVSTYQEAETVIGKSMSYEAAVETASKNRFLLLAEVISPSPYDPLEDEIEDDGATILENMYNPYLNGNPDAHAIRLYEDYTSYPGAYEISYSTAIDSMNAGAGHVLHAGHGSMYNMSVGTGSILNYDAAGLTNADALFTMYLLNCTNVAFDTDCLAEFFMLNPNGGAFSVTGASRSSFPSVSSRYLDEYYRLLFDEDMVHLGETFANSRIPFTPLAVGETADRWTHFIYTYLGDPELCIFRKEPEEFSVDYPASALFGPNEILVTVTSGGMPFDSAYVCLYKDGDDYAYGSTNSSGEILFSDFLCRDGGNIELSVTGIDHKRYEGTIAVTEETGAFIRKAGTNIVSSLTGNGDQLIDSGETLEFEVSLENTGGTIAQKLWAILRTNNEDVNVYDSVTAYPDIPPDQLRIGYDPYIIAFDPSIPDEEPVEFTIEVHDSTGGFWSENFAVEVHAPRLELFVNLISDEAPYGNENGIIEEGENFLLKIGVKNFGTGEAQGLEGEITSLSKPVFFVVEKTADYGSIGLLETGYGDGFVARETSLVTNNYFTFELTDDFGRVFSRHLELRVPSTPINISLDASYGPTEMHVTWQMPDSLEDYKYCVSHSLESGTGYEVATADLVKHKLYRDADLLSSTRYYFTVAAVDSCGNLSVESMEASATTNPPQLDGWPQTVNKETASSPKLGDLDGDTYPDVVVASQYIHAWHADGVEIRDGDSQPVTWGILNTEGDNYVATVALGELDGNPGLEIVGASWDSKEIYVFDHDGNTLPGFPKPTTYLCWASPVIGDFDGVEGLEIIAYDVGGIVYVWHADGTELADGDSNPATDGPFFQAGVYADGWHVSTPALADIDEDGVLELIVAAPSTFIYCLNSDGSSVPGWPVPVVAGANISASPAVGDIDDDGLLEVVVQNSFGNVYGLNNDGTSMSGWPKFVSSGTFFHGSPALADLLDDGKLEVVIPGMNGYLYIFDHTGAALPGWPQAYSDGTATESSPIIVDLDSDQFLDIVLGNEDGFINAWNIEGEHMPGFPIQLNAYVRGTPTLGDLDDDGDMELVASCWNQNVYVWDIEAEYYSGAVPWNGFHSNIFNDGCTESHAITGSEGLAYAYQINTGMLFLSWSVNAAPGVWDLYRAEGDGEYTLLASELSAGASNMIEYVDLIVEEGLSYRYKLESVTDARLSLETEKIEIPVGRARLYQNYPNPFNPSTKISFTVPGGSGQKQNVLLVVYDIRGAVVKTLVSSPIEGGRHDVVWDGSNDRGKPVASGVYFSSLRTCGAKETKKMLLLR
ncbi:MAG: VCBS repeat-containing protein [Candidatus Krumholzibacteriota bacterium]|nr:VCBS repeat-containing protein [Candidatus Krumholzibacteriota bacterium]